MVTENHSGAASWS